MTPCSMVAGDPVSDGTYTLKDGSLINYTEKWAYGYIVGMPGGQTGEFTIGQLVQLAESRGWTLFGSWVDPETGTQYVDPVKHVAAYQDAERLARENGELAFYGLRDNETVRLFDSLVS